MSDFPQSPSHKAITHYSDIISFPGILFGKMFAVQWRTLMATVAQTKAVDDYITANANIFSDALRGKKSGEAVTFTLKVDALFLQVLATLLSWRFIYATTTVVPGGIRMVSTR